MAVGQKYRVPKKPQFGKRKNRPIHLWSPKRGFLFDPLRQITRKAKPTQRWLATNETPPRSPQTNQVLYIFCMLHRWKTYLILTHYRVWNQKIEEWQLTSILWSFFSIIKPSKMGSLAAFLSKRTPEWLAWPGPSWQDWHPELFRVRNLRLSWFSRK